MRDKFLKLLAVVFFAIGSLAVVSGPAAADDPGELGSCTHYVSTGIGPAYGGGNETPDTGDWYAYSPWWVVSSSSACEDFQITNLYTMSPNMKFRLRFAPSGGGTYANSWKYVNNSCWTCNFVIGTNIANGTWLRLEGVEQNGSTQVVWAENVDVKF